LVFRSLNLDFLMQQVHILGWRVVVMKGSSVAKLVLAGVLALAGLGTLGFIGVQTGNITIIFGNHNKVENGAKPEAAPAKPVAEIKHEQSPALATTQPSLEPAVTTADVSKPVELAHARRTQPAIADEEDEACTCPDEEEADEAEESEPEPIPVRMRVQPRTVDYSQTNRVYVQGSSVSVNSSVSGGQRSRTRVVVNGQVVVDQ
jgi:hypothetical protein